MLPWNRSSTGIMKVQNCTRKASQILISHCDTDQRELILHHFRRYYQVSWCRSFANSYHRFSVNLDFWGRGSDRLFQCRILYSNPERRWWRCSSTTWMMSLNNTIYAIRRIWKCLKSVPPPLSGHRATLFDHQRALRFRFPPIGKFGGKAQIHDLFIATPPSCDFLIKRSA